MPPKKRVSANPPTTPPRDAPLPPKTPKIAALTAAANRFRTGPTPGRGHAQEGSFVAPVIVESSRYEEWMKMATDNKITSTNAWNFALIDYFADMSLLRNGDDNSINFQKASCTLDGCVKIWTSRVDSVATETGKLLSGLAEDGRNNNDQDDEEDDEADGDDDAREARIAKQKSSRAAVTLADNFSKIKLKSLDLEFTVDPLFKKTSADFDEGGAGGILMNHLGCDGSMRVVFDAGDARLEDDEEVEEIEFEEHMKVDISKLRSNFLPSLDAFSRMSLCPSLANFRFSADAILDLGILNPNDDDLPLPVAPQKNAHFADEDMDMGGFDQDFGGGEEEVERVEVDFFADDDVGGAPSGSGPIENYDPRRVGERDLVVSMSGEQNLDYFDSSMMKNWAGPEHWKMRKVASRRDEGAVAKPREKKIPFIIDFKAPPLIPQKELFAPGLPASIRLAGRKPFQTARERRRTSKLKIKPENYTLPPDYHFSSQMLTRLFLKPKLIFGMRNRNAGNGVDEQFWAAGGGGIGEQEDQGGYGADDYGGGGDDGGDDDVIPNWDTQFLHGDDNDVPYFDELTPEVEGEGEQDLLAETQGQLRRVRVENVNYAKRAKRVDVKKLKDSIWKELEDITIQVAQLPTAAAFEPELNGEKKVEAFTSVVSGLRKLYPVDKMEEISTSFCFICLLHLANEKGLRIQTPLAVEVEGVDEGLLERRLVGGLDQLRVFREITQV